MHQPGEEGTERDLTALFISLKERWSLSPFRGAQRQDEKLWAQSGLGKFLLDTGKRASL